MREFDYDFDELDAVDELLASGAFPVDAGRCRECGCTEGNACPGGCIWATPAADLCSRCARREAKAG